MGVPVFSGIARTSRYFVSWSRAARRPAKMKNGAVPPSLDFAISNSHIVF